jgi:hypothetical protein
MSTETQIGTLVPWLAEEDIWSGPEQIEVVHSGTRVYGHTEVHNTISVRGDFSFGDECTLTANDARALAKLLNEAADRCGETTTEPYVR